MTPIIIVLVGMIASSLAEGDIIEGSGEDVDDIVISVGELVKMYNGEEEQNHTQYSKQITDGDTVDFNSVAGQFFCKMMISKNCNHAQDAAEEKRCLEKVVLEERTEWDQEIQCHHRSKSIMNAETSYQLLLLDNITVENIWIVVPLIMHGLLRWWQNLYSSLTPYQVPAALLQVLCDSLQPSAGGGVPRQLQKELLH